MKHEPPKINANPFYLCQPEVRKARHEMLIKKRPPRQTIAETVRSYGHIVPTNEDDENQSYNDRSRIVKSPVKPPVHITIENVDQRKTKPAIPIHNESFVKFGRRAVTDTKRNRSKIIDGNYLYTPKKKSSFSSSTTMDDEYGNDSKQLVSRQSLESPSFFVLKDPIRQNKWI